MKLKLSSFALLLALASVRLTAVDITFGSPAFEIGKTSTGSLLTGSFTFALGSFGSFTPTAQNTSLWLANFTSLGTTSWDESFTQFNDSKPLASNATPFTTSNQAYIWGYNLTSGAGEWVLLTNANWTFPVSSTLLPTQWTTSDAGTLAILGTLGTALVSADPYLRTAAVNTSTVPEPATVAALLGFAALGLSLYRRRSARAAALL